MNKYLQIINDICHKNDIKLTTISNNWIHILEKDNKTHYIMGYNFDLNSYCSGRILDDKYAFYELVKLKGYPIIEHNLIYKSEEIKKYFEKYNHNVVIKANNGTCGIEVFWLKDLNSAYQKANDLLLKNYSLSLCPYIEIKKEYRVIVLNNEALLVYGKVRPIVIGDGIKTIEELLIDFNPSFFKNQKNLPKDKLAINTRYVYNWQFNLSRGATVDLNIDDELKIKLKNMALRLVKDIGIKFCSVDIIEDVKDDLYLMEANSGVMLNNLINILPDGEKIAYRIYEKAIKLMFQE